jgi:hypothetical protein
MSGARKTQRSLVGWVFFACFSGRQFSRAAGLRYGLPIDRANRFFRKSNEHQTKIKRKSNENEKSAKAKPPLLPHQRTICHASCHNSSAAFDHTADR